MYIKLILLLLLFISFEVPKEPIRSYKVNLPIIGMNRHIGAQDEAPLSYEEYYVDGQITKISLRWDLIEYKEDLYNWNVEGYDLKIQQIKRLFISTRATPKFYRKYSDWTCSQPKEEFYINYATFLIKAIERYRPSYIELWNEPDVLKSQVEKNWALFGCWDTGSNYGKMTQLVYPLIKEKFPNLNILIGALTVDNAKWLNEFLESNYRGDIISYHSYSYHGVLNTYNLAIEKSKEIKSPLPVFISEISLLDYSVKCSKTYQEDKAQFLSNINKRIYEEQIMGYIWYTIGGNNWYCSDLLPGDAYIQYKYLFGYK